MTGPGFPSLPGQVSLRRCSGGLGRGGGEGGGGKRREWGPGAGLQGEDLRAPPACSHRRLTAAQGAWHAGYDVTGARGSQNSAAVPEVNPGEWGCSRLTGCGRGPAPQPQSPGAGRGEREEGGPRGGAAAGAGPAGCPAGAGPLGPAGPPVPAGPPACPVAGGGSAMKLKLKNVFLVYFLVSIAGLLYALVQLGERGGAGASRRGEPERTPSPRRGPATPRPAPRLGWNPGSFPALRAPHGPAAVPAFPGPAAVPPLPSPAARSLCAGTPRPPAPPAPSPFPRPAQPAGLRPGPPPRREPGRKLLPLGSSLQLPPLRRLPGPVAVGTVVLCLGAASSGERARGSRCSVPSGRSARWTLTQPRSCSVPRGFGRAAEGSPVGAPPTRRDWRPPGPGRWTSF